MKDESFEITSKKTLTQIAEKIEEQDKLYEVEIDFKDGVLNLEIQGKIFVLNKQSPSQEIWLASPISGPSHFKYKNNAWLNSKNQDLFETLSKDLSLLLNKTVTLS